MNQSKERGRPSSIADLTAAIGEIALLASRDAEGTLEAISGRVERLLECESVSIHLVEKDERGSRLRRARISERYRRMGPATDLVWEPDAPARRMLDTRATVFVPDLQAELTPADHAEPWVRDIKSAIYVPFIANDVPFGLMIAQWLRPQIDDPEMRGLADALGQCMAVAMQAARGFAAERAAARRAQALAQSTRVIAEATHSLDAVLDRIEAEAARLFEADSAIIHLADHATGHVVRRRPNPLASLDHPRNQVGVVIGSVDRYRGVRAPTFYANFQHDPRIDTAAKIMLPSVVSAVGVPVWVEDALQGLLIIDFQQTAALNPSDLEIAQALGEHAGIAIVNARLADAAATEAARARQLATEAEASLASLRASEGRFRDLVESSPDAIFVSTESELIFANSAAARLLKAKATLDILGEDPLRWLHPDAVAGARERGRLLIQGTTPVTQAESRMVCVDGEVIDVEISARWTIFEGRPAIQSVVRDVTERTREAERRRLAAERAAQDEKMRAIGELASGVAHDLNQNLALISTYCEVAVAALGDDIVDASQLRGTLSTIANAALDGGESVARLLTFARRRESAALERVDVAAVLDDVMRFTQPRWRNAAQVEGRHIRVNVDADHDVYVLSSPSALREALVNLVFNAIDALSDDGTITLGARRRSDVVEITVADNGVGMSEEVRSRIFDPFYTTKGMHGTGLGLPMVRRTVELHGGSIEVESAAGQGTIVRLILPAVGQDAAAQPPPPLDGRASKQQRVLVVDDNQMLAIGLKQALERAGHAITVASSGEIALTHLRITTFDVVLTDIGLGEGMTGWDLVRAIRADWPDTRVVVSSGSGAAIDPDQVRALGVRTVLAKPYRLRDLRAAVADP